MGGGTKNSNDTTTNLHVGRKNTSYPSKSKLKEKKKRPRGPKRRKKETNGGQAPQRGSNLKKKTQVQKKKEERSREREKEKGYAASASCIKMKEGNGTWLGKPLDLMVSGRVGEGTGATWICASGEKERLMTTGRGRAGKREKAMSENSTRRGTSSDETFLGKERSSTGQERDQ